MRINKQSGFHVIELAIILLAVGAIGFGGYKVWQRQHPLASSPAASTASVQVPQIKTVKDLDSTSSTLDHLDTSSGSTDLTSMQNDLNAL